MAKKKKVPNEEKDKALIAEVFFHKVIVEGVSKLRGKYKVPTGGLDPQDDYIEWEKKTDMAGFLTDIGRLLKKFKSEAKFEIHNVWIEPLKRLILFYESPDIIGVSYPEVRVERNSITGENELWVNPTPYTSRDDWEYFWRDIELFREMQKSPWPDERDVPFKSRVRDSANLVEDMKMLKLKVKGWSIPRIAVAMKLSNSEVTTRLYKIKKRFGYSTNPGE